MDVNPQQIPRIDYPAPDPERPYVYPGTQILINHFQIRSMEVLQRVVDTVAGLRGEQLKIDPLSGDYDLKHLCAVHRVLFQDIFAWAGQIRTVDIEKQRHDFVLSADIPGRFQFIHEELKGERFLRGLDPEEFVGRLAHYWYSIYSVHAFRDGNSRAMRHFFDGLAAAAGYKLDFAAIDGIALMEACRHRFFRNDAAPLSDCLRQITSRC